MGHLGLAHPQQTEAPHEAQQAHEHQPKEGPVPPQSPSDMFMRVVRGMLPHVWYRGSAAFQRVKAVEGVPDPFDTIKKMVVPDALKNLRLKPGRKSSNLGALAGELGWGYKDVVAQYEEARKERSAQWYEHKKKAKAEFAKAQQAAS